MASAGCRLVTAICLSSHRSAVYTCVDVCLFLLWLLILYGQNVRLVYFGESFYFFGVLKFFFFSFMLLFLFMNLCCCFFVVYFVFSFCPVSSFLTQIAFSGISSDTTQLKFS